MPCLNHAVKHRPHSRRVLGDRFDSWQARNRRKLLIAASVAIVTLVLTSAPFLVGGVDWPALWYVVGAVHAAIVGGLVWMMNASFLAHDQEAIRHVRGAWGEENTSETLKQAQRKKLIWGWVDTLDLQRGDIDHLVVTRSGGVVAIDSKWRNEIHDHAAILDGARRMKTRSEGILRTHLAASRGSHRARGIATRVTPLVVIWGAAQSELPDVVEVEGLEVVSGSDLLAWLRSRSGDPVSRDAGDDLLKRLERYRDDLAAERAGAGA